MLWRCSELRGYEIAATDGTVGSVDDLLFDEARWALRWAVADTGGWLSGRKLLLPASALGHPDAGARRLAVGRSYEATLHGHYGRKGYWGG